MADPIITGSLGPILKPVKVSYDPVRGLSVHLDWESAGAGVVGVMNGLMTSRTAFEGEISGHKSHVAATLTNGSNGFPDQVQDSWQLQANEIHKDIKEFEQTVSMENTEPGSLAKVLTAVDGYNSGDSTIPTFSDISDAGARAIAVALFAYMIHGGTHFARGQYVFRWVTHVSYNSSNYRVEGTNELLYSTSQVLSEANPPAGIAGQMTSIAAPSSVTGYYWSWRRIPSTRSTVAGNRIEISTEYVLDQWSTFVYALA